VDCSKEARNADRTLASLHCTAVKLQPLGAGRSPLVGLVCAVVAAERTFVQRRRAVANGAEHGGFMLWDNGLGRTARYPGVPGLVTIQE
jgi:hypothetical protein